MTDISLKEFLLALREGDLLLAAERNALLDERFKNQEEARKLQAGEYERRLSVLNHAHEQALEVAHTYITLDKWDDNHTQLMERVSSLETWRARAGGVAVVLTIFAGTIGAAIAKVFLK